MLKNVMNNLYKILFVLFILFIAYISFYFLYKNANKEGLKSKKNKKQAKRGKKGKKAIKKRNRNNKRKQQEQQDEDEEMDEDEEIDEDEQVDEDEDEEEMPNLSKSGFDIDDANNILDEKTDELIKTMPYSNQQYIEFLEKMKQYNVLKMLNFMTEKTDFAAQPNSIDYLMDNLNSIVDENDDSNDTSSTYFSNLSM